MDSQVVKEKVALSLSIALIAFFWVWVTMYPNISLYLPGFVIYLTWASGFLAGGGASGFKASLTMNLVGLFWAYVGIWLAGFFPSLGIMALPVAIGVVCLPLCFMAVWTPFAMTPCGFIGAASLFAVANSAQVGPHGINHVAIATIIAILAGNITMPISEKLIGFFLAMFGNSPAMAPAGE